MKSTVDSDHPSKARLADGVGGHVFAVFGSVWFAVGFGAMAAAVASLLFSGPDWMEALEELGKISAGMVGPFLLLGYPQPFFFHSVLSRFIAVAAFAGGFWLWLSL